MNLIVDTQVFLWWLVDVRTRWKRSGERNPSGVPPTGHEWNGCPTGLHSRVARVMPGPDGSSTAASTSSRERLGTSAIDLETVTASRIPTGVHSPWTTGRLHTPLH